MKTIESINSVLNKTSATNGWDVLVAYDSTRINKILSRQYQNKMAAGDKYPPFSHTNTVYGLQFKNIIVGAPKISFENANLDDSAALVRLEFISGDIIRIDADGQVIQWDRISPGNNYAMEIRVELKYGNGSVSEDDEIAIHFDQGTLLDIRGLNKLPNEILAVFRNYLRENAMKYSLGRLKQDDASHQLYPREFIVRTQRHPDASSRAAPYNTEGAVLLFIATNYEGKGSYPTNEQPWIIPHDKSATMLISDRLLFGPLLAEQFAGRVKDLAWSSSYSPEGRRMLEFTQGYVPTTDVIKGSYRGPGFHGMMWSSDSSQNERPARLSMADFQLEKGPDNKTITGRFSEQTFTDIFTDSLAAQVKPITTVENVPFKRTGTFNARLSLDKDSNIVFNGSAEFNLDSAHSTWNLVTNSAEDKFIRQATDNLNKGGIFKLGDIKTFYIRSVLFPEQDVLSFSDVALPGDLVMYGEVKESMTSINVTAEKERIAAGQTLRFSASLPDGSVPGGLEWSVNGVGSIDDNGLYRAPALGKMAQAQNIIVTAKNAEGLTGSALMTVLSSSLELLTAFITIPETHAPQPFQLQSTVTGTTEAIAWRVESDLEYPGTIDSTGLYTPPAEGRYAEGFNVVMAIALLPSGEEQKAIICLKEKSTQRAFRAEPAFHPRIPANGVAGFSTRSRDFDANQWELFPQIGSLSEPTSIKDGDVTVWSSNFHAPGNGAQARVVLVKMTEKDKPWHGGYGLVELMP